jgi:L,D-transpeptidase ErfK/SrfK
MTLNKRFFSLMVCAATALFSFSAWADDSGAEIPPAVYAAQEAAASAVNYGQTLCNTPGYYCRQVGKDDTWYSLFPNYQQRREVMRLNRTNVALMYRNWIAVPKDFSKTTYMDMSPLPKHIDTHGRKEVYIDLSLFAFGAYGQNGNLVYWGPESSGRKKCYDSNGDCSTATGSFSVFRIEGKDCISHEFPLETHGGDPMPYCMYFHNGTAMHYSTLSGFINRSAGCVRLFKSDAKWLNKVFVQRGTEVVVRK